MLICLTAMLVLAFTLPAAAKTTLTVSGSFINTGFYLTNPASAVTADEAVSAAFLEMRANVMFKLQAGSNLWFKFGLNLMDRDWGYADNTGFNRYWDDQRQQNSGTPLVVSNNNMGFNDFANFSEVTHANMTYLVHKGYIWLGRGQSGPSALGAMQTSKVGANRDWKADDDYYDAIAVNQTFGPWNLKASIAKVAENDGPQGTADQDYDSYTLGAKYTQKWGYVSGGFNYTRDRATWIKPYWHSDTDKYTPSAVVYLKLGKAMHLSAEGSYKFGSITNGLYGNADMDIKGWDFALQGEYIDGRFKAGAMFAITNGQDPTKNTTSATPVKTVGTRPGDSFHPLYAAFGQYDGLLYSPTSRTGSLWNSTRTNFLHKGLQFYYGFADYRMMEKLWVHAALGFMRWDEDPRDKDFGTEFDLGANYTIKKGLGLGVHFGYFIPGSWFTAPIGNHLHLDAELTMKF